MPGIDCDTARLGALDPSAYERLVQSVIDYAIFMLNREGRVASWNPGAERIKGYAADEIVGFVKVTRDLKGLFITGYAENAAITNGGPEPGMHVMSKPFAMDKLAARIKSIIDAA